MLKTRNIFIVSIKALSTEDIKNIFNHKNIDSIQGKSTHKYIKNLKNQLF